MKRARASLVVISLLVSLGTVGAGTTPAAARNARDAVGARTPDAVGARTVRLPGQVLPALTRKLHLRRAAARRGEGSRPLTLTLVLRRAHQAAFDRYLASVADPASPQYHRFLSQRRLAERFGPSPRAYAAVLRWLRAHGLRLTQGSANRLTLSVRASQARAARAFGVRIRD